MSLLGIGNFERPSFQWQFPNLLSSVPVAEIVAEVVDIVAGKVAAVGVDIVATAVGSDIVVVLALEHSLADPSRKNLGDFSNPDYKY